MTDQQPDPFAAPDQGPPAGYYPPAAAHQHPAAYPPAGYQQVPAGYGHPGAYPPPGYPPAAYGQPPFYGQPAYGGPQAAGTNGLAIAALVCSIFGFLYGIGAILGIVFGFIARSQIKQRGGQGNGLAIAGIVIGIGWFVLFFAAVALALVVGGFV